MKLTAVILFTLFLFGCKTEKTTSVITIDVQAPVGKELKNLSEIATDIQYIPLETKPEALMRFVNYLKAADGKFYINTVSELLCFDKNGKFLYKLDKKGRGPEEYTYLTDYDILPEKKLVMVLALAGSGSKLIFYNETDSGFRYLNKLDILTHPRYCDFIPGQDNNILLSFAAATGENEYQCVIIDQEGDTILKKSNYYSFTRQSNVQMGFSSDNIINCTAGIMRIKGLLSDTMYTMAKDYKFVPYMIMNTGGKGLTPAFLSNIPAVSDGLSPAANLLMNSAIFETERFMLYRISYQQTGFWGVYDKTLGETSYFYTEDLLKDDISGGINIEPKFCHDGVLYSWTDALTFRKYMSDNFSHDQDLKNPQRAMELQKLAESIQEDDNHILIVITPK